MFTKRLILLIFVVIIICGGLLRLYRVETLGTFRSDQAIELSGARQILNGKLALIGIKTSNSEVRNGAVMYYLLAPVLLAFKFDPVAGGVLQTGLQLATIVLVFGLFRYFGQPRKGLAASFLLAFSPLLVQYSRQTLLAFYPLFFDTLAFCLMAMFLKRNKKWLALGLGLVLGFGLQIHYSVLAMIWVALALPILFRKNISALSYYLLLGAGLVGGFSPMLAFEMRHEFFNTKMLLALFTAGTSGAGNPVFAFISFWPETIGQFLFGNNSFLGIVLLLLLAVGTILNFRKLTLLEKLAWWVILATITFTLVFSRNPISHYAIGAFIPIIILIVSRSWRLVVAVVAAAIFLAINLPAMGLTENHGYSMHDNWNMTKIKTAAEIISHDNKKQKYNVAMLVDAENQALPLRYFLDFSSNVPLPVWDYSGAEILYVVIEPELDENPINIWEVSSFGLRQKAGSWDLGSGFKLVKYLKLQPSSS